MNIIKVIAVLICFHYSCWSQAIQLEDVDSLFENIGNKVAISTKFPIKEELKRLSEYYPDLVVQEKVMNNVSGYLCYLGIIYSLDKHGINGGTLRECNKDLWPNLGFEISDEFSLFGDYDIELSMGIKSKAIVPSFKNNCGNNTAEYTRMLNAYLIDVYKGRSCIDFWNKYISRNHNSIDDWRVDGLPEYDISLCYACFIGKIDLVEKILNKGAKPEDYMLNRYDYIPFSIQIAAQKGFDEILALLLNKTPSNVLENHKIKYIDFTYLNNRISFSPVISAAANGNLSCLEVLSDFGFYLNIKNTFGNTALHRAVRMNRKEVVKYLIDNDLDPLEKNMKGETSIDIAKKYNVDGEILEMLIGSRVQLKESTSD